MKFIEIHARMVDVDRTHLLSIYTGAIRELYRKGRFDKRYQEVKLKGKSKKRKVNFDKRNQGVK